MKKYISIIMVIVVCLLAFSGCSDNEYGKEYIIASDMVKYNIKGTRDFGFNVSMICRDNDTEVEFVSFEGTNVQGLQVRLADDTFDNIKDLNLRNLG